MNTQHDTAVRIVIDGSTARVHAPYRATPIIKAIPGCRGSRQHRAWLIPSAEVPRLYGALRRADYQVATTRTGKQQRGGRA